MVIPPKKIQPDFLYILLIISEVLIRRVIMTGNTKYLLATRKEIKVYKTSFSMVKKKLKKIVLKSICVLKNKLKWIKDLNVRPETISS